MKINDFIHAIKVPFEIPGTGFWRIVYIYIVVTYKITIIDSGVAGSEKTVFNYLKKIGRKPEDISNLIITHAHPDHIGSAKAIQDITGCKIGAHKNAVRWIENIDLQNKERPVPGFYDLVDGSTKVNFTLGNGEILDLKSIKLKVFETPGHSEDSISLFDEENRVLITGDVIPQWNDLPIYNNYFQLLKSLQLLNGLENINWLLSSWDDPVKGNELSKKSIEDGINYITSINKEIMEIKDNNILENGMELCRTVIGNLGLSESNINPMVAKSFLSHLKKSN